MKKKLLKCLVLSMSRPYLWALKKRIIKMTESAKKERRTEWMQIRVTPQEKEFLKQAFGDQTAFVRAAIRQAAKERGVTLPN